MSWFARTTAARPAAKRPRPVVLRFEMLEARDNPALGWSALPAAPASAADIQVGHSFAFDLDAPAMRAVLGAAPADTGTIGAGALVIALPAPDGREQHFRVVDAPVMAPELAAQFPDIKTYRGQGIDDPTATLRLDQTPQGLHAQVLSAGGAWYVDPYSRADAETHLSYYGRDLAPRAMPAEVAPPLLDAGPIFSGADTGAVVARPGRTTDPRTGAVTIPPAVPEAIAPVAPATPDVTPGTSGGPTLARATGTTLRTYRLAVAATGEYTAAVGGGTVAGGQAAIVTIVNRVDGVYETELAVRMVLVANNSSLVYTNASTDPYTNNNGSTMLGQNQTVIDSIIGSANYDIGHVFSTGGGGVAYIRSVGQASLKAGGVTGLPNPVGDAFAIDYVAHEMGHQFGGNHTFNTTSVGGNRNAGTAYEPGSGSTIMAYAGVTGGNSDLQPNSDPYFAFASLQEIVPYLDDTIPGVGVRAATGNAVPTVSAGPSYVIPAQTPFELTASGADADGDALTYSWEQRNLGAGQLLTAADNGASPLFRVFNPTASPTRTFPRLSNLVNNTTPLGEKLPTANWSAAASMRFRVTVRDNRSGGGGTNDADTSVQVVATGSAFTVTSFNSATTVNGLSAQTVTWNVAGTTAAPISAATVNILLSLDGGFTYPVVLASGVPNDGSEAVTVPNTATTAGRIRVQPVGNIFFDISNANLTIAPSPVVQGLVLGGGDAQRSRLTTLAVNFDSAAAIAAGAFSITGVSPAGTPIGAITADFTTQLVNGKTVATLTFSGAGTDFGSLADGSYVLSIDRTKVTLNGAAMAADYSSASAGVAIRRLFGDSDGDGGVDTLDLARFRQALGSASGQAPYNAALDFDGDGSIDTLDLARFRQRLGTALP